MLSKSETLDFYRDYGKNTDPGESSYLYAELPETLEDLCELVKTQLIHPAEVEKYATVVSLTPGWLRSENMLNSFGVTEENWQDALERVPDFATSETPSPGYCKEGVFKNGGFVHLEGD